MTQTSDRDELLTGLHQSIGELGRGLAFVLEVSAELETAHQGELRRIVAGCTALLVLQEAIAKRLGRSF